MLTEEQRGVADHGGGKGFGRPCRSHRLTQTKFDSSSLMNGRAKSDLIDSGFARPGSVVLYRLLPEPATVTQHDGILLGV